MATTAEQPGNSPSLQRTLNLPQATAINLIDMVGIGPFVTLPFIVGAMQGPACILAWLLGAALALLDGCVWAELGAKWPLAGGSYAFLQKLWPKGWGRYAAFLFIFQTAIQAPLVLASGAIGFANYFGYLQPLGVVASKAVSGGLVVLIVVLLYRKVATVGVLSIVFGIVTAATLVGIIVGGIPYFDASRAFNFGSGDFGLDSKFLGGLGNATQKTIYCYLGYYNVCHLGAEIRNPVRVIPRSIFLSIGVIALLYIGMQLAMLGVLPWEQIAASDFVVSLYVEKLYGSGAAQVATGLILVIAVSSLFAVALGYSRILYAAAADGNFFAPFARLHPRHNFPHVALLFLGGVAFAFSLLFRMGEIIAAIITMRIGVQFVSQTLGLIYWHYSQPSDARPWKMYLFPLVPIASICIWLFVLAKSDWIFIAGAVGIIALGSAVYFIGRRLGALRLREPSLES
jgi:fructoselysine transporter